MAQIPTLPPKPNLASFLEGYKAEIKFHESRIKDSEQHIKTLKKWIDCEHNFVEHWFTIENFHTSDLGCCWKCSVCGLKV